MNYLTRLVQRGAGLQPVVMPRLFRFPPAETRIAPATRLSVLSPPEAVAQARETAFAPQPARPITRIIRTPAPPLPPQAAAQMAGPSPANMESAEPALMPAVLPHPIAEPVRTAAQRFPLPMPGDERATSKEEQKRSASTVPERNPEIKVAAVIAESARVPPAIPSPSRLPIGAVAESHSTAVAGTPEPGPAPPKPGAQPTRETASQRPQTTNAQVPPNPRVPFPAPDESAAAIPTIAIQKKIGGQAPVAGKAAPSAPARVEVRIGRVEVRIAQPLPAVKATERAAPDFSAYSRARSFGQTSEETP